MDPPPPISTLFPYTTLFRSIGPRRDEAVNAHAAHPSSLPKELLLEVFHDDVFDGLQLGLVLQQPGDGAGRFRAPRSEEHTSELQSHVNLVCRLLLEKKKKIV